MIITKKNQISRNEIHEKIFDVTLLKKGDESFFGDGEKIEMKRKYPRLEEYHLSFIEDIFERFSLRGKAVLEIGGSNLPFEIIKKLCVKKWVSLDTPWWTDKNYPHTTRPIPITDVADFSKEHFNNCELYEIAKGISDNINVEFHNRFDIIVSNCCFEHIMNLPLAFENFYKALRDGGVLYSSFSPIFSAYHGHHCWFTDEVGIRFNDLKYFPEHGHLLLSKAQIYQLLKEHNPNNLYLNNHADLIKYGFKVNRHFYEDYGYFIKDSSFGNSSDGFILKPNYEYAVSDEIMSMLHTLYPGYKRFDAGGVVLFAQKPL